MTTVDVPVAAGFLGVLGVGLILIGLYRRTKRARAVAPFGHDGLLPIRFYIQAAPSVIDDLYRQSSTTDGVISREVTRTEGFKQDLSAELHAVSAGVGRDRQRELHETLQPRENETTYRALALERTLERYGQLFRVDFTSDEPFEQYLSRIATLGRSIGFELTPEQGTTMRRDWQRTRGVPVSAEVLAELRGKRGYLVVTALFEVMSTPTDAAPGTPLVLQTDVRDSSGQGLVISARSDADEVVDGQRRMLAPGSQVQATVFGLVVSTISAAELEILPITTFRS